MYVDDLDIPRNKIAEPAQRILDRAIEESRRHGHALLTSEHLFLAGALVEWDLFAEVMRNVSVNPHDAPRRGRPSPCRALLGSRRVARGAHHQARM